MSNSTKCDPPCVVVSQPMYFPWIGMLQQIKISDIYVYYNDVQFVRGFFNRVQIKTEGGVRWLTVPLQHWQRGELINEVKIDNSQEWKQSHINQLNRAYHNAPYKNEMLGIVDSVLSCSYSTIDKLSAASTKALVDYYPEIGKYKPFVFSSSLNIRGSSTERLMDICLSLKAKSYLTGHGARNYLEHEKFDKSGITVNYVDYVLEHYLQLHGKFTPYVSALDLIANCGREGLQLIHGSSLNWKEFIDKFQK